MENALRKKGFESPIGCPRHSQYMHELTRLRCDSQLRGVQFQLVVERSHFARIDNARLMNGSAGILR